MQNERIIPASELIINGDGSVFHLRLRPGEIADTILLVGDPARVEQVAAHFGERIVERENREFRTVTGWYKDAKITVCSTGIGTDNIDIVLTELDALANVDFETRTVRDELKSLTILRLGTCGALQTNLKTGDLIFSRTSIGMDSLLCFYEGSERVRNIEMERALPVKAYCVDASPELAAIFEDVAVMGLTLCAPGFYAPQGRWVRLRPADMELNAKLERFGVTNIEMESSAVAGLGRMMGHRAGTLCAVVAQRRTLEAETDYRAHIEKAIETALEKLRIKS